MPETHPLDLVADDLLGVFTAGQRRLENLIAAGLRRGLDADRVGTADQQRGDATQAYRDRQLAQARALLRALRAQAGEVGPLAVRRGYTASILALERSAGEGANLAAQFGTVHVRQVEVMAANLTRSLQAAVDRVGVNVETVFERAQALDGGLPPGGIRGLPFIGRRVDDPYRNLALETIGEGTVSLETRRQVSANLARRLIREGVSDGVTAFVDAAGRRWGLDVYTETVARTTTREAASRATVTRMRETRLDLVTITSHQHAADECSPYDGATFSLSGNHPHYNKLDRLPPFHPRCRHVVTPAAANLDEYLNALKAAARGG